MTVDRTIPRSYARTFWRSSARRAAPSSLVGAAGLALLVLVALLSPLAGYPIGADVDAAARSQGPTLAHWLGTDHLGRDVFWRVALASRTSVGPGLLSCAIAAALGVRL